MGSRRKAPVTPPRRPASPPAAAGTAVGGTKRAGLIRVGVAAGIVVVAVLIAWANTWHAPFVLDDQGTIVDNATLRDVSSGAWMAPPATAGETVSGRPVLNLSFALNHAVGGLTVRGYHLTNTLIHACAALLVLGVVRRTLRRGGREDAGVADAAAMGRAEIAAMLVALAWALHPLQTAAVTYVSQRAESLAGLFYLGTLYAYIRASEAETRAGRRWWAVASVAACSLGVGTKEILVTAPVVAVLWDRTFAAGSLRAVFERRRGLVLALFATWLPLAALVWGNQGRGGSAGWGSEISAWAYLLTQGEAIVRYLGLTIWPRYQVFDYGTPLVAGWGQVWPQVLLLAGVFAASVVSWRRHPVAAFLGLTFFMLLAPSSSVVPVATQTIAEHRFYLALLIPLLAGGTVLWRVWPRRGGWPVVGLGLAAALVGASGVATWQRNAVYGSAVTLWRDTAEKRPDNARAHHNLGIALVAAGEPEAAMTAFARAIEIRPEHAFAHFSLGALLARRGEPEAAAGHFEAALAADPDYADARVNLGVVLAQLGRPEQAVTEYRRVLEADPTAQDARLNLGSALIDAGRAEEAIPLLETVVAARPGMALAHFHLGRARARMGRGEAAERAFGEATRLDPMLGPAWLARGNLLAERGQLRPAEDAYRRTVAVAPEMAGAYFGLGNIVASRREIPAATELFEQALRLDPKHVGALANLGNCQLMLGRLAEAVATYDRALQLDPGNRDVRENRELAAAMLRR